MPFFRFHLDTPLSPDEAMARLRPLIHERKRSGLLEAFEDEMLRSKDDVKPLSGQINGYSFRVQEDRWRPFTAHPRIWGAVLPAQSGSRIRIALLPNTFTAIGLFIWTAVFGLWSVDVVAAALTHGNASVSSLFTAIAVFALIFLSSALNDAYDIRDILVAALRAGI